MKLISIFIENQISILAEIIILMILFTAGYIFVTSSFLKPANKPSSIRTKTPTENTTPKQVEVNHTMTAIGYKDGPNGDEMFVIPEKDRQNIGIFGEIGSGKTSILRLLIMQDIMRKTGFLLIDPHREFSREVLSMIPQDMQDRVVYISLASLYQFGKTVCINPLQTHTEHEKYIRTAGCIDNLKQYFSDGWGHRLETVLRNMINLVMSTPDAFKFLDIIGVLFDENKRMAALQKSSAPAVRDFWTNVFPKFAPEAAGAIYNKFDKIINTPPIAAMFSSVESTINIKDIIEEGKIVIVDLGSAATVDIIEFMGTMLINMFNLENKIRFDLGDSKKVPFNIYIDEVHMFSAPVIRELLNNVRKYNMKVTVATQSIKVLDDKLAKELDDLFRCMIMFRCDFETARLLARNLPKDEKALAQLGFHRFAAFSQGFERVSGIGKTRHIEIPSRWKAVAEKSLERYGKEVKIGTLSFSDKRGSTIPKLSPLEYFLLNTLHLEGRDVNEGELIAAAKTKFGIDERAVKKTLDDSLISHHKYVIRNMDYQEGRHQFDTKSFVSITKIAIKSLYSRAYAGPGAGGTLHRSVISTLADHNAAQHHYCIVDLADSGGPRADLMIYSFKSKTGKKEVGKHGIAHPDYWSEEVIAVEVETDPTKHKEQVYRNYDKNASRGMHVWFVIFEEKYRNYIMDRLAERDIGKESYEIFLMNPQDIDCNNKTYESESESINDSENKIIDSMNTGYQTLYDLVNNTDQSPSQVFAGLANMERKGLVERSGVLKTKKIQQLDGTGTRKTHTKKTTFRINPDILESEVVSKKISEPDESSDLFHAGVPRNYVHIDDDSKFKEKKYKESKETIPDIPENPPETVPSDISTDSQGKYHHTDNSALKIFLEDSAFTDYDEVCYVLKLRGYGVRKKKNGGITLFRLP